MNTKRHESHDPKCADRIRTKRLVLAGEPAEPEVTLLHAIAEEISACCGISLLKAHRLAWDWTVDEAINAAKTLCKELGVKPRAFADRSWLGWEAGDNASAAYQDLLCRLFQTSAVRLGLASDHSPAALGSETVIVDLAPAPHGAITRDRQGGDPTDRRQAMTTLSAAMVGAGLVDLFAESAAEAMEFTRRAEASDIGPQTLEHLDVVVAGIAASFAHTSPHLLFPRVLHYRRHVALLLEGNHTLREQRALYRYSGWLSIALSWLTNDLGDPIAANANAIDAWEHGWQAEDGEICAWSMDTASTIAFYNNQFTRARDSALKGLAQAPPNSAAAVRLSCQVTRAYGVLLDADNFDTSLSSTRRQFDRLPAPGSGLFSADAARIASYAATSSLRVHRPEDAVVYAQDALQSYADVEPGQRSPTREAIARLDLAQAYMATNTPDGAAHEALVALDCERPTGTLLTRAGEVAATLRRTHPTLPMTRQVTERLSVVTATARALTAG